MSDTNIYLVTGAVQERGSRTRSPVAAFTDEQALVRFLRENAEDPDNEESVNVDNAVVFRLRDGCQYFVNAPIPARRVLAGETWPD